MESGGGNPSVEMEKVHGDSNISEMTIDTKGAKTIILCVERGNTRQTYSLTTSNGNVTEVILHDTSSYFSAGKFMIENITSDTITLTMSHPVTNWIVIWVK